MKDVVLVCIMVLVLIDTGRGQAYDRLGIQAGIGRAEFHGAGMRLFEPQSTGPSTGFLSSIHAKKDLNQAIGLQADLLLSQKGYYVDYGYDQGGSKVGVDLRYIDFAILGVAQGGSGEPFEAYLGPYLGLFLFGKGWSDNKQLGYHHSKWDSDGINRLDYGLMVGLGYRPSGWLIDIRGVLGFRSLYSDFELKHQQISILIGRQL